VSAMSRDGRAIVDAVDRVRAEISRLADVLPTPGAEDAAADSLSYEERERTGRNSGLMLPEQAAAADEEQTLRWIRRESLLVLLTRLQRGRTLTEEEAMTLRHHVETEMREAETARSVAAGNKRHVQTIVPEMDLLACENEQLRAVLAEVFETFAAMRPEDGTGEVTHYRSPRVLPRQWEQWCSVARPATVRPWWEQLAEAQAAIARLTAWCDELDATARNIGIGKNEDSGIVHPVAANIRAKLAPPEETSTT
jgi:hypothetical protein